MFRVTVLHSFLLFEDRQEQKSLAKHCYYYVIRRHKPKNWIEFKLNSYHCCRSSSQHPHFISLFACLPCHSPILLYNSYLFFPNSFNSKKSPTVLPFSLHHFVWHDKTKRQKIYIWGTLTLHTYILPTYIYPYKWLFWSSAL